jgi:hypothetical protein
MILIDDFRVLWPAAICLSGFRPQYLLHTHVKLTPQRTHQKPEFWVCVSNISKTPGDLKTKCYDKPLLCPSWLFIRALKIIRTHFCKEKLTKRQYHDRYNKYWLQLLRKGFGNLILSPTHVTLRRFPGEINEMTYISDVLSHTSMEPALRYSNIRLQKSGKLDLFGVGRGLRPVQED